MTPLLNVYNVLRAEAPPDLWRATSYSFVYSFTVTAVLSKGNLAAGLTAGALAVCAVVIQVVSLALVKKGNERFGYDGLTLFDRSLCFMIALLAVESGGMKGRASLFLSLLPLLLTTQKESPAKTPLIGIYV